MSSIVVIDTSDLEKLIRTAVRAELDSRVGTQSQEWVSIKKTGLPPTTVRQLVRDKHVRGCLVGRALHVHAGDLARHLETKAMDKRREPEPAPVVELDAFEQARARARARRAS